MSGKTLLALLGIVVIAVFFRFWQLSSTPPGLYPDEAMNGNNALEAIRTGAWRVYYPENNGREGLMMNFQAISIYFLGNTAFALRVVGAIFGTLTVLGLFLFTRLLFHKNKYADLLALISSFFLATSFWHINFSRMSFRAILAPFFLVWSFYFLWKIYQNIGSEKILHISAALGGIFFGLGFYSYIAYRSAPILLLFPLIAGWREARKDEARKSCFPCLAALFLLFTFITVLPLGLYYLAHPADFLGRTAQVSIFSDISPIKALGLNIIKTAGMFWVAGDYNWRHNFAGAPQLSLLVGIFFAIGLILALFKILKKGVSAERFSNSFLLTWIVLMLISVIFSSEGIPHALRAIAVIPPVMIISAEGFVLVYDAVKRWLEAKKLNLPQIAGKIERIEKEFAFFLFIILLASASYTFNLYFQRWAVNPNVEGAFAQDYADIAHALNSEPRDIPKYVVVNAPGVLVREIPMPAQTIMYLTDTFLEENRQKKNIFYVTPENIPFDKLASEPSLIITAIQGGAEYRSELQNKIPGLKRTAVLDAILLIKK